MSAPVLTWEPCRYVPRMPPGYMGRIVEVRGVRLHIDGQPSCLTVQTRATADCPWLGRVSADGYAMPDALAEGVTHRPSQGLAPAVVAVGYAFAEAIALHAGFANIGSPGTPKHERWRMQAERIGATWTSLDEFRAFARAVSVPVWVGATCGGGA